MICSESEVHFGYGPYRMGLFMVEAGFCNKPKTTTTNVYTTTNGSTADVYTNCIMQLIYAVLDDPDHGNSLTTTDSILGKISL